MPNPYFQFKQFTICQDVCAMKVGTDGVLLGAWANVVGVRKVLDVGTGTGLIALMLAQRSEADIVAIELDKKAANQAIKNCVNSPWPNRIKVIHAAFQQLEMREKFDLIVSNPPYFSNSLKSPSISKNIARHDDQLSLEQLVNFASKLLQNQGSLDVILPADETNRVTDLAALKRLHLIRKTWVHSTPNKPAKRVLLSFSPTQKIIEVNSLIIEENGRHQYSKEYKKLCGDFYLNF